MILAACTTSCSRLYLLYLTISVVSVFILLNCCEQLLLGIAHCPMLLYFSFFRHFTLILLQYNRMNMDSRLVVVTLGTANRPEGVRLTLRKDEPLTSVYNRVATEVGMDPQWIRIGCNRRVFDTHGQVDDTNIKNEDLFNWMEYPPTLKFQW